jgi:hypothetical protein
MVRARPGVDTLAERLRKFPHFRSLSFRDGVRPLIIGNIALLAKQIELPNDCGVGPMVNSSE